MGVSSNTAYAGTYTKDGKGFTVFYANAEILAHWNRGRSRVHPDNWKAGWYWHDVGVSQLHPGIGPFPCSRAAYKDAKAS